MFTLWALTINQANGPKPGRPSRAQAPYILGSADILDYDGSLTSRASADIFGAAPGGFSSRLDDQPQSHGDPVTGSAGSHREKEVMSDGREAQEGRGRAVCRVDHALQRAG